MEINKVIGIEGFVGAGKTAICREMLNYIPNSILLNGGNLYRAIIHILIKTGKNTTGLSNMKNIDIKSVMDLLGIEIRIEERETQFYINGEKIEEDDMQSKESSIAVSKIGGIADNSKLFEFAKNLIDDLKLRHHVIVSGRSLIKIYPELDYHFFITADVDVRVDRKYNTYKESMTKEELKEHIEKRDELQKQAGFYDLSNKTICIDVSDCKSVEDSVKKVLDRI